MKGDVVVFAHDHGKVHHGHPCSAKSLKGFQQGIEMTRSEIRKSWQAFVLRRERAPGGTLRRLFLINR